MYANFCNRNLAYVWDLNPWRVQDPIHKKYPLLRGLPEVQGSPRWEAKVTRVQVPRDSFRPVEMSIGLGRIGYGKIHIQTRKFYSFPNPKNTRTTDFGSDSGITATRNFLDWIWTKPKSETRNPKICITIKTACVRDRTHDLKYQEKMDFNFAP